MYVYCVESVAHIECHSDCSRRGSHLVEPLCYGVVYCSAVTVEQGSGMYGSRTRCGTFDDCIWLADKIRVLNFKSPIFLVEALPIG